MTARETGEAAAPMPFDGAFLRRLERLTLRTRRIVGLTGGRAGALRVPAADFVDHRPYSPGDDTRHIDWPAVARHDEVFVKVGRGPQSADVCLLLDRSASMAVEERKRSRALELAAALAWIALHAGDRVTVVPFAADALDVWGPATGSGRGPALLRHLAALPERSATDTRLAPAARRAASAAPAGGMAVVVSDLWLADDLHDALGALPAPRWDVLLLQLLDRDELVPTLEGSLLLEDSESGQALDLVIDAPLRAAYRSALHARLDRVRSVAADRAARVELIPADWPLERAVIPYLQAQAVLAG